MMVIKGTGVYGGIAIGKLVLLKRQNKKIERHVIEDVNIELMRFASAKNLASSTLQELYEKACKDVGMEHAAIFEVHQMMLEDPDFVEAIEGIIKSQKVNAEYAVNAAGENFAQIFTNMKDTYMQARAADIKDVAGRILEALGQATKIILPCKEKVIIAAEDLAPSETIQLDKDKVLGFITTHGSANSHTAILARTLGIPAIVNTKEYIDCAFDGTIVAIDGYKGIAYLEPDKQITEELIGKMEMDLEHQKLLEELKGKKSITKSGKEIKVFANISGTSDLVRVLQNDAEGIGLFRSEFLYMQSNDYPSEETQFEAYKLVAETMGEKLVVIRTFDIGADKKVPYLKLPHEENPALGMRAIRISLNKADIFKVQLKAICRASVYGNLAIMFPMIISKEEVVKAKKLLAEVQAELKKDSIAYDEKMQIGIMIETPAAALISESLAKEVDFFSIGTNDLSQYTLAIDRQNEALSSFFNAKHPAILRLIELTAVNALNAGIWVGICGELGADLSLTEDFIRMGISELSVSPPAILPLRKKIISCE